VLPQYEIYYTIPGNTITPIGVMWALVIWRTTSNEWVLLLLLVSNWPLKWDRQVVPKRLWLTTILRCITSQKSVEIIFAAAEALESPSFWHTQGSFLAGDRWVGLSAVSVMLLTAIVERVKAACRLSVFLVESRADMWVDVPLQAIMAARLRQRTPYSHTPSNNPMWNYSHFCQQV
jgi:hypothetical protein